MCRAHGALASCCSSGRPCSTSVRSGSRTLGRQPYRRPSSQPREPTALTLSGLAYINYRRALHPRNINKDARARGPFEIQPRGRHPLPKNARLPPWTKDRRSTTIDLHRARHLLLSISRSLFFFLLFVFVSPSLPPPSRPFFAAALPACGFVSLSVTGPP